MLNIPRNDFSGILYSPSVFTLEELYGLELAQTEIELEHEAYTLGEDRFRKYLESSLDKGSLDTNAAAAPLVETLVDKLASRITEWVDEVSQRKGRGRKPVAFPFIQQGKPLNLAAVTVKTVMSGLVSHRKDSIEVPLTVLAGKVGKTIEEELRFSRMRELENGYFQKYIKNALAQRTDAAHKKAYLSAVEGILQEDSMVPWNEWANDTLVNVGIKMLELLIESTGLIVMVPREHDGSKDTHNIVMHEEYIKQIMKRAVSLAGMSPMYQPMVVPPKPWTSPTKGGYWADGRAPVHFIRCGKKALKRYQDVYMPQVYEAINIIQDTPWRINKKVLDVVNQVMQMPHPIVPTIPSQEKAELPVKPNDIDSNEASLKVWKKLAAGVYRGNKSRESKRMSIESIIEQANKFAKFSEIYFPYNMDWRGRVYAIPQFNPQSNDIGKGLLTFAKGKPMGAEGIYWMKIHTANCAGVDKVSFKERIKWVEDHKEQIMNSAIDSLGYTWWTEQDDAPFCLLAACFEMYGAWTEGESYVSSLPIAFDGSCSGIQHFSAMLRDEVGGAAVNLTPSESVSDIYRIVADKVNVQLQKDYNKGLKDTLEQKANKNGEIVDVRVRSETTLAKIWLEYGVTRKVTKRSVMTLAYGSKEYGFADQLLEDIIQPSNDAGEGIFNDDAAQCSRYLAKLIWTSVKTTVIKAVEAMEWLQKVARLLSAEVKDKKTGAILRERLPTHWVTTDGFPVWQEYQVSNVQRLNLMFLGTIQIRPRVNSGSAEIDARKQAAGIAPNFVHSNDGAHLRRTVVHANKTYGITQFALIHDSFGTLAADAGNLKKAVPEAMVDAYAHTNVFEDFMEQFADQLHESQLEDIPAIPSYGKLDLNSILESDYAFA